MVEVVAGPQTAAATLRAASDYSQSLGMWPCEAKDAPGFLVNRLLCMYLQAAMELLLEGVEIEAVDEAATHFGMDMGPLQLCDEIGLDVVLSSGRVLWEAFPDRVRPSPLLVGLVKAGKLGCKKGEGFFHHTSAGAHSANAGPGSTAAALVAEWSTAPDSAAKNGLADRLLLPMAREAQCVADEGIVPDRQAVDRAAVRGLGFPASHGGPLQWVASTRAMREQ